MSIKESLEKLESVKGINKPKTLPANEEEISKLEDKFGVVLPSDYKEFLSIHNGWKNYRPLSSILSTGEILDNVFTDIVEMAFEFVEESPEKFKNVLVVGIVDSSDGEITFYNLNEKTEEGYELLGFDDFELKTYKNFTDFLNKLSN